MSNHDLTIPLAILTEAKRLITLGWTQFARYRDSTGNGAIRPEDATCWCLTGAVIRAAAETSGEGEDYMLSTIRPFTEPAFGTLIACLSEGREPAHPIHQLATWNDAPGRTQEEAIALLDKAIAKTRTA